MVERKNSVYVIQQLLIYSTITLVAFLCIAPFLLIISGSLTSEREIMETGFSLFPKKIDFYSYHYLLTDYEKILTGYKVSGFTTVFGTLLSLAVTSMMAYPLSRPDVKYRNIFSFYAFFTMLFSGGMVPWYIVCTKYLGLKDTLWALILPHTIGAWNLFLLRNYFKSIPAAMYESATIDGAGEWKILFRIILPLSLPGMATVGLFISLGYWNDWWLGLMLINKNALYPLQLLLRTIVSNVQYLTSAQSGTAEDKLLPSEGIKMATCLVTIGPVILVYPFLQRYFIKGIMVGAVKG